MKTLCLISLIIATFSCNTETVINQGTPTVNNIGSSDRPVGSTQPADFYFAFYSLSTKQIIEVGKTDAAPRIYVLKDEKKIYVDEYISPNWGAVKYDNGVHQVKWHTYPNACGDGSFNIKGAFRESFSLAMMKDGFKDFYLEWKGKDLGFINFVFEGVDKFNNPNIKELNFNKKIAPKSLPSCGGIFILEVNQ